MKLLTVEDFKNLLPKRPKLLGLDISKSAIGIAFCEGGLKIVTPLIVIRRGRLIEDSKKIDKIIKDYDVHGLIVGWPLNMDGSEGGRCQAVKDTMSEIVKHVSSIPFLFWDERLSTMEAREFSYNGEQIDKYAAKVILESFIAHNS